MKKMLLSFVLCSIPFLYGCKELKVTYADSGKTIYMVVDQNLKLELAGDATSGNVWRSLSYNDTVMRLAGKPNYMLADEQIGAAGVYYYRFRAVSPGKSTLIMEYGSKFDMAKEVIKTFVLEIEVLEKP